jgi:hypothetical protein
MNDSILDSFRKRPPAKLPSALSKCVEDTRAGHGRVIVVAQSKKGEGNVSDEC